MDEPRIVGGHVALDLVNTVSPRPAGHDFTDWLDSPQALAHWARRPGLVTDAEAAASEPDAQAWHAAIDVREALYGVLSAALGRAAADLGGQAGLEILLLRWSAATARSALRIGGPGEPPAVLTAGAQGAMMIPDRLAYAAMDLVRTADMTQLRACPIDEGGCGWLFLDRSRNHSRRWCAMQDCGALAKSRRLTDRRRTARGADLKITPATTR